MWQLQKSFVKDVYYLLLFRSVLTNTQCATYLSKWACLSFMADSVAALNDNFRIGKWQWTIVVTTITLKSLNLCKQRCQGRFRKTFSSVCISPAALSFDCPIINPANIPILMIILIWLVYIILRIILKFKLYLLYVFT